METGHFCTSITFAQEDTFEQQLFCTVSLLHKGTHLHRTLLHKKNLGFLNREKNKSVNIRRLKAL